MYQQQQNFHGSSYRGNTQGHDTYLRGDSSQPSNYVSGGYVQSQYQGTNRSYQPAGQVQSFYGQQSAMGQQPQGQSRMFQSYQQSAGQTPESFHTSQYRGHQQGHDTYLRSDSTSSYRPSGFGAGAYGMTSSGSQQSGTMGTASYGSFSNSAAGMGQTGMGSFGYAGMGAAQPSYTAGFAGSQLQNQQPYANPQSFHTSQYQGNQPGHDMMQRADATRPTNSGWTMGGSGQY